MFSSSVRTALFALAASAVAVSAAPGLSLKVTGPSAVNGVSNLKVSATLTNTGDETLKVLNDPLSPLSTIPANTFAITNADGASPSFAGVKAKFVPQRAAELGSYVTLAPGESKTVEHDLSEAYDFSASGEGSYDVEARNVFQIVQDDNKLDTIYASAEAHTAEVVGSLTPRAAPTGHMGKRATFRSCSSTQQSQLNAAATSAQTYAANALSYANSHTSATTRYTTWFGAYTAARHTTITSHYSNISGYSFSSYTFDCTCTDAGTYAYVYPDTFPVVYLCGAFWQAPVTGTDSRAGTLIHESSHFTRNGGTEDYVYGQSGARSLASSNPANAVFNADNHEYFAENNPAQS
ncbi:deuterolysin M35 metalloprotease [Pluteus cervinus]|uniref:Deuterolysin M35 metalloprotease n=1 Tax=Pluteus cervinus TaxID=181527 RepID=A0ACD3B459_9AGAR|nr:deuterolysin M35 metalloprotease [Pluteus cervinus]